MFFQSTRSIACLTLNAASVVMGVVPDETNAQRIPALSVALCVDGEVLQRLGRVLRHLAVGLVDQAIRTRLVSTDARIEDLALGPIQTVVHQPIRWPVSRRRTERMIDALAPQPPTLVHAMSHLSYRVAWTIAEHFDSDLVLQVTSLSDCGALAEMDLSRVGRIVTISERLRQILESELKIPIEQVEVIRPGVQAFDQPACFARPDRVPTVLCTAALEKGFGVDRLIEAAEILRRGGRRAMFFLLGQGSHESALRRLARDHEVSATVTFAQPGSDALSVMTSADLYLRPADRGAFHADGLQAMGAGLAVVTVPDSTGDHFRSGETAMVCEGSSAKSLAAGIEELLQDRALAQRLASSGLDYVRSHHSMSAMAERAAALYRQLALIRSTFTIGE